MSAGLEMIKDTSLRSMHREEGGRLVELADWMMPIQLEAYA